MNAYRLQAPASSAHFPVARLELQPVQLGANPVVGDQFVVAALFGDAAAVENQDGGGMFDGFTCGMQR